MTVWLSYREAAHRVHRSRRTIGRWRKNGMPMSWDTRDGQRVRVVDEAVLLAWWRQRLRNDPAHRYRLRALRARETGAHGPTRRDSDTT
ncbi:hypothetical protein AOA12_10900 [Microbacterium sp. No. 7]|nr:hypothetical protein AOA12_10900 [Microbacterium sp. No. 7]